MSGLLPCLPGTCSGIWKDDREERTIQRKVVERFIGVRKLILKNNQHGLYILKKKILLIGIKLFILGRVSQNSLFEEITPATAICRRGETFCLGIMTSSFILSSVGLTLVDNVLHSLDAGLL